MRFEEEDAEPVAVVRVMADFALALTLIVLMLVGTHAPSQADERAASRAATRQPGAKNADLTVSLVDEGKFVVASSSASIKTVDGATVAKQWFGTHSVAPESVVVQFHEKALAADLHRGLLDLQTGFGTNAVTIQTIPVR